MYYLLKRQLFSGISKHPWLSVLLAGLLWGISSLSFYTSILVFPGLVIFWWSLLNSKSYKEAVKIACLAFFVKSVFIIIWFYSVYPLMDVGSNIPLFLQLALITFVIFCTALSLSVGGVLLGLVASLVKVLRSPLVQIIILSTTLVLAETLSAISFSLFNWGQGSFVNSYFGFSYSGLVLANYSWLVATAVVGGIYALTFILASVTLLPIVWKFENKKSLAVVLLIFFTFVGFCNWYIVGEYSGEETEIALVTTDFTALELVEDENKEKKQQSLNEAVAAALVENPDYILLPEDSRYMLNRYGGSAERRYSSWRFEYGDPDTILIDSEAVDQNNGERFLRANIYDGKSKEISFVDKRYLVPLGEYIPSFYIAIFKLLGGSELSSVLVAGMTYVPGPQTTLSAATSNYLPLLLFCFEAVNPRGVNSIPKQANTAFVAHPISHGRFYTKKILTHELYLMQRTQAVWSRLPIAVSANAAKSQVYLPNGKATTGEVVATGDKWQVNVVSINSR